MKTVIWLLILIGWSVLQARKKAMRERERKQRAGEPTPAPAPPPAYSRATERTPTGIPGELDAIMQYARSRVDQAATTRSIDALIEQPMMEQPATDEIVTREVADVPEAEVASQATDVGPRSLRTYFVMREVLGPPRAKKRFHPRIKAQD
jgi:hypothetical protein